jgi:hypothetical protein
MNYILLVLGPLAGIWLGNWLSRAKEERQWRRDRCLEAYADVMRGCETVVTKATELYLEKFDPEVKRQALMEQITEFHRAQQRAALLVPAGIEKALLALVQHTENKITVPAGASSR